MSGFKSVGDLLTKVKPLPECRHFGHLLIFFSCTYYNEYSYKKLLFRTIKVFKQTLSNASYPKAVPTPVLIYSPYRRQSRRNTFRNVRKKDVWTDGQLNLIQYGIGSMIVLTRSKIMTQI